MSRSTVTTFLVVVLSSVACAGAKDAKDDRRAGVTSVAQGHLSGGEGDAEATRSAVVSTLMMTVASEANLIDSNQFPGVTIACTSSNPQVAAVVPDSCHVTALAAGTATIAVQFSNSQSLTMLLTIVGSAPKVASDNTAPMETDQAATPTPTPDAEAGTPTPTPDAVAGTPTPSPAAPTPTPSPAVPTTPTPTPPITYGLNGAITINVPVKSMHVSTNIDHRSALHITATSIYLEHLNLGAPYNTKISFYGTSGQLLNATPWAPTFAIGQGPSCTSPTIGLQGATLYCQEGCTCDSDQATLAVPAQINGTLVNVTNQGTSSTRPVTSIGGLTISSGAAGKAVVEFSDCGEDCGRAVPYSLPSYGLYIFDIQ